MKLCLIVYHKNLKTLYPSEWIDQFRESVLNQTNNDWDLVELNYGNGQEKIFDGTFFSRDFPTFVHAVNFLLDYVFSQGYDYALNHNVDDIYSNKRIEAQLPYMAQGYDIISSNFSLVVDGRVTHRHKFHNLDIEEQLSHNHNLICHPTVCYSADFWGKNRYLPEEQPMEDLKLWQRAIKNSKFFIVEDDLLFHRIHNQSVCQSSNR